MFIGIIVGIVVIFGVLPLFFGGLKKAMEVISFIAKLCIGGFVSMLIYQGLQLEFESWWGKLAFIVIGAIIIFSLIAALSGIFRLVGYSINYFTDSFIILLLVEILGDKVEINFIVYALVLFVFPRIMWISDRTATTTEYSHSEYSMLSDVTTNFYTVKDIDWFENLGDSWRLIPLQIVIASIFYAIGSFTIVVVCSIKSVWLLLLYIILATAINIIFDMFVFKKIDRAIGE